MPEFERTIDTNGQQIWRCVECAGFKRGHHPPRNHKCDLSKRGNSRKKAATTDRTGASSSQTSRLRDEIDDNVSVLSVPSPFLQIPVQSTPTGPPTAVPLFTPTGPSPPGIELQTSSPGLQEQMRRQMESQVLMQQQMIQQQQNLQKILENQQLQMQQNMQLQQQENAAKENVMKEFIEESRRKEAQTRDLIEVFQKQTLNSKKIPCPKWTKDEHFKAFSSRLQNWDKNYPSKFSSGFNLISIIICKNYESY